MYAAFIIWELVRTAQWLNFVENKLGEFDNNKTD
jgi:hypothetical protein